MSLPHSLGTIPRYLRSSSKSLDQKKPLSAGATRGLRLSVFSDEPRDELHFRSSTPSLIDKETKTRIENLKNKIKLWNWKAVESERKVTKLENKILRSQKDLEKSKEINRMLTENSNIPDNFFVKYENLKAKVNEMESMLSIQEKKNSQSEVVIESLTNYIKVLHDSDFLTKNQLLNRARNLMKLADAFDCIGDEDARTERKIHDQDASGDH